MDKNIFVRNKKLDMMRIIAAIAVVSIHVSASRLYISDIYSSDFFFSYMYDSLSRFGVPFFFMISGVLFLNQEKEITLKKLWLHNILRIAVIYILWSALYTLPHYFAENAWNGIGSMIEVLSQSSYHLWFLPVIIAIYSVVPFLRTWIKGASQKEIELFLILFFVFNVLIQTADNIELSYSLSQIFKMFSVDYMPIHICCFVLGYYLYTYRVNQIRNVFLVIIIVASYAINVAYGVLSSRRDGMVVLGIFDYDSITTLVAACAFFLLLLQLRTNIDGSKWGGKLINELSRDSLGVYLIHLFFVIELTKPVSVFNRMPAVVSIPLVVILVYVASTVVSALLRRIPFIGRYIC